MTVCSVSKTENKMKWPGRPVATTETEAEGDKV